MDIRHPACKLIASVLSGLLILNPIVAAAAELAVDAAAGGNTAIGAAGNGVPVVNIATPNGAGLSHNKFTDYSVGQRGLILNNAPQGAVTQLGGTVGGNPNLQGGAAGKILNEVTGANPSQLRGYTEVAGQSAHVIVANPHGITCNGCGFINTPRATLTTGKPLLDGERLRGYDVDGGEIAIDGAGLNAANVDKFELITRSAKLNAELYANQLSVVTGRNQVDAETLAASAKADDGSAKPQLAIDSSALGGMYAGAIRLVGTEQGVGVKLAGDLAASAGDIQIDANGKLSLAQTSTVGSLRAKAPEIDLQAPAYAGESMHLSAAQQLTNNASLAAGSRIELAAEKVENKGLVKAGVGADGSTREQGELRVNAGDLRNSGALLSGGDAELKLSRELDNRGGAVSARSLRIDAGRVDNRGGQLLSAGRLAVQGTQLDNRDQGLLQSGAELALKLQGTLDNAQGQLLALDGFEVQAALLNNQAGVLFGAGPMSILAEQLHNRGGSVVSRDSVELSARQVDNREGQIQAQGRLALRVDDSLDNRAGQLIGGRDSELRGARLDNREQGTLLSEGALALHLQLLDNKGGWVQSAGDLLLDAARVENYLGLLASDASLSWEGAQFDNRSGELLVQDNLRLNGTTFLNHQGRTAAKGNLSAQLVELQQHQGQLIAGGAMGLSVNLLESSQDSLIAGNQNVDIKAQHQLVNVEGEISSQGGIGLQAEQIDNGSGLIASAGDAHLEAVHIRNQRGVISSQGQLNLLALLLDNSDGGLIVSRDALRLDLAQALLNQAGRIASGADLLVVAQQLDNSGGQIAAAGQLKLDSQQLDNSGGQLQFGDLALTGDQLDNRDGELIGQGDMRLDLQSIDNRGGRLGSVDSLTLNVQNLDNQHGELLAGGQLNLAADRLDNREGRIYGESGQLKLGELDNGAGSLESRGDLSLTADKVDNQEGGRILSEGTLSLFVQELLNRNGLINANRDLTFQGLHLDNQRGLLASNQRLALQLQHLDNQQGLIRALSDLSLAADNLDNRSGNLLSNGRLLLDAQRADSRQGVITARGPLNLNSQWLDLSQGGLLQSQANLQLSAAQLWSQDGGKILGGADLSLSAGQLNNQAGLISGLGKLDLTADQVDNRGGELSATTLQAKLKSLDNRSGLVGADGSASLELDTLDNQSGQISADVLVLSADQLNNQAGKLLADSTLSLISRELDNRLGYLGSQGDMRLQIDLADNREGVIRAGQTLQLGGGQFDNQAGQVYADGELSATLAMLNNGQQGQWIASGAMNLKANELLNETGLIASRDRLAVDAKRLHNRQGELSTQGSLLLSAGTLDNSQGRLIAGDSLAAKVTQHLANVQGLISAKGIDLQAASLANTSQGLISSQDGLRLAIAGMLDNQNQGQLLAQGPLHLTAQTLSNRDGLISSGADLHLQAEQLLNQGGALVSDAQLTLAADTLANGEQGLISAAQGLRLDLVQLDNQGGGLYTNGALNLLAAQVNNSAGSVSSTGDSQIQTDSWLQQNGELFSLGRLDLNAQTLLNLSGSAIAAADTVKLSVAELTNQASEISSQARLELNGGQIDNQGGNLYAQDSLQLQVHQLNNQQGLIAGQSDIALRVDDALRNAAGQINSAGRLDLSAAHLDNQQGEIASQDEQTLSADHLDNRGGKILGNAGLNIAAQTVDNREQGLINARDALRLHAGELDNRQQGGVAAGNLLQLTLDRLRNGDGGQIVTQGLLALAISDLEQAGGILSGQSMRLDLRGNRLNNDQGVLSAEGTLDIFNASTISNNGGEIGSGQDLRLSTAALENNAGSISTGGNLRLDLAQGELRNIGGQIQANRDLDLNAASLLNQGGTLLSGGDLRLNLAQLDNSLHGSLQSAGILDLQAQTLNNQGGELLAQGAMTLDVAQRLDNRDGGRLATGDSLQLRTAELDNRAGTLSSVADLSLQVQHLLQQQGALVSGRNLTLDLSGQDLDNQGGQISAQGQLLLSNLRDLDNRGGQIASAQDLAIKARNIDNGDGGQLLSEKHLTLEADQLRNAMQGLISGWQGLNITASSLDNQLEGTLSSRDGELRLQLAGDLLNANGGAIVSQGAQWIGAQSVDNRAGIVSAGDDLKVTVAGTLDNGAQGLITGNNLTVTATSLNNDGGQITGQGTVQLKLAQDLNNQAGQIGANHLAIDAARIDNRGASLVASQALSVDALSLDNRQSGTLFSEGSAALHLRERLDNSDDGLLVARELTLDTGSLGNRNGTLQSIGDLTLHIAGLLDNQSGRISSETGSLLIAAQHLDNQNGTLDSLAGPLQLHSDSLDNHSGTIQAASVELSIGQHVDNGDGFISALSGDLSLRAQSLDNRSGVLQGDNFNLALEQSIDNRQGLISAVTGNASVRARHIDNQGGGLYAYQRLDLAGESLDNHGDSLATGGRIAAGQLDLALSDRLDNQHGLIEAADSLSIAAATLDNRQGLLRDVGEAGSTRFAIAGLLDNRGGSIESANHDLRFDLGNLLNQDGRILHSGTGEFGLNSQSILQAGGLFGTNGLMTLQADRWVNDATLQAGRLNLHIGDFTQTANGRLLARDGLTLSGDHWINDGIIASDGNLSLDLTGGYSGSGLLSSLGNLDLNAFGITLSSTARIAGGGDTHISALGVDNAGRITAGGNFDLNVLLLNNKGTLGAAQGLRISAWDLINDQALIFSGGDLSLRVDRLTNRQGDLYSLGGLSLSGASAAQAERLDNYSGRIESAGNMTLHVDELLNRRDLQIEDGLSTARWDQLPCIEGVNAGDCSGKRNAVWQFVQRDRTTVSAATPQASIQSGGSLQIQAQRLDNSSSLISAAGNLDAQLRVLNNHGVETGEIETTRVFRTHRTRDVGRWERMAADFTDTYWFESAHYDPARSVEIPYRISTILADPGIDIELPQYNTTRVIQSGDQTYAGIIQAGGAVNVQASQSIGNGVQRPGATYVNPGVKTGDTSTSAYTTRLSIDGQVDLRSHDARVNPLDLPGVSLPTGNGLFRLSDSQGQHTGGVAIDAPSGSGSTGPSVTLEDARASAGSSTRIHSPDSQQAAQVGAADGSTWQAADQIAGSALANLGVRVSVDGERVQVAPPRGLNPDGSIKRPGAEVLAVTVLAGESVGSLDSFTTTTPTLRDTSVQVPGQPGSAWTAPSHKYLIYTDPDVGGLIPGPVIPDSRQPETGGTGGGNTPDGSTGGNTAGGSTGGHTPGINTGGNTAGGTTGGNTTGGGLFPSRPDAGMSSDYLLALLGYDPDRAQKRLGDGLYEQYLLRQAVMAATGQRFINGMTSDSALFKYLMDNAIAYKDSLHLSLGVSLSAEQVAALTHDIVWLEEATVNGEKVLVPVLYLAKADQRLSANGALIQGQNMNLISGGELANQGTLRASENLDLAARQIDNQGRIDASQRLDILARDDIRNRNGGLIKGGDVSLTSLTGDVINERSVTRIDSAQGSYRTWNASFADSAARIEASGNLAISAGRDVSNLGGTIRSAGDLTMQAGRDLNLHSAELANGRINGRNYDQNIQQLSGEISAGRDLTLDAGRDVSSIASRIDAARDIGVSAGRDVTLASAADEQHSYISRKKYKAQNDLVEQQATTVKAGGDIAIYAGQDLSVIGSQVRGGGNVALDAERDVAIVAAQNEQYAYLYKKKEGSWGKSKTKTSESASETSVASVIQAGGDLSINVSQNADGAVSLNGGRDVVVAGSQLNAGNDLLLGATGDIYLLSKEESQSSASSTRKSGSFGLNKKGNSQVTSGTTQAGTEVVAGNDVVIAGGHDITLSASRVEAGRDAELRAGLIDATGDINLLAANEASYSESEKYRNKVGFSTSGNFVSIASAKKAGQEAQATTNVGSQVIAGRDASMRAERDINVVGSDVEAGRNATFVAGRDVNVLAGSESQDQRQWKTEKHIGLALESDRNGFTAFAGAEKVQDKSRGAQQTAAGSQLTAGQDVSILAGRDINQQGSHIDADRDINLQAGRNISIDAASEGYLQENSHSRDRAGMTANISHNVGNTLDALNGTGQGDNSISKASSVLGAADAVNQFASGPSSAVHLGTASQSNSQRQESQGNSPSTLEAGRDITAIAGNAIDIRGSQFDAGRDITLVGKDITLDVARGVVSSESKKNNRQTGNSGQGNGGSARAGIGSSSAEATEQQRQGTSTAPQMQAGRDVNLNASNDLTVIGAQVTADRNIDLHAGNDLKIRAAQNDSDSQSNRHSGGAEVGLAVGGKDLASVYASAEMGKGTLERDAQKQHNASITAGNQLHFDSGKDTTIAGATLRGKDVVGRVGGDLTVSSLPDTGKASGKQRDVSGTVSIGLTGGGSVSGSVGTGKTDGSTHWVEQQTSITGKERVDIRTENHTQIDGALLAADNNNLKLDTNTLGFRDIQGEDKENSYYANVGGSTGWGDGGGNHAPTGKDIVVDASQERKGERNSQGWSVSGYNYEKDREQIVRATVGDGQIIVRDDARTEQDSTVGLNRDPSKAYDITRDKTEQTDLYVSQSSLEAIADPQGTAATWQKGMKDYGKNAGKSFTNYGELADQSAEAAKDNSAIWPLVLVPGSLVATMDALSSEPFPLGIFPGVKTEGGLFVQLPVTVLSSDGKYYQVENAVLVRDADGNIKVSDSGKPILDMKNAVVREIEKPEKNSAFFTNGINNSFDEALVNAAMQTGKENFILNYNPTHGIVGDLLESGWDTAFGNIIPSANARDTNQFLQQGIDAGVVLEIFGHSQGSLIQYRALDGLDFAKGGDLRVGSIQFSGSPVDALDFHDVAKRAGFTKDNNRVFQVNRPDEVIGIFPKGDAVSDLVGRNATYSDAPALRLIGAILSFGSLFGMDSPHSNYLCQTAGCLNGDKSELQDQFRNGRKYIVPTFINDKGVSYKRKDP